MSDHGPGKDLICVGAVSGARGLKGEVRIKTFTATPEAIADYGDVFNEAGDRSFGIRVTGKAKGEGVVLARLTGIDDRDAADAMKGHRLYVPKSAMPEPDADEYYFDDLIGLSAEDDGGGQLGRVTAMYDFGAGPIMEIGGGATGSIMVPFTKATVPVVDIKGGRVVIVLPDGLLDEPEEQEE